MKKRKKVFAQNNRLILFSWMLFFMLIHNSTFTAVRAQDNPCDNVVAEAEKHYDVGRFSTATTLLRLCLPKGIPEIQRISAYRLLALAYLAEDRRDEAKEAINKIFDLNRNYTPDPVDSPPYQDLVAEVKKTRPVSFGEKYFGGRKRWLWIGGGVLGATGVVYALVSQKDKTVEPDLPEAPGLP